MRIAHISDLHLLEPDLARRSPLERARLVYLSLLRPLSRAGRVRRFARALHAAKLGGFDHLVISGDLTEDGKLQQFEEVARVLSESRIPAESVTLVPGNHDAYEGRGAWERALLGPLRPFAPSSAQAAGNVVDLGPIVLLPISTAVHQHWASSWGSIDDAAFEALERRAADPGLLRRGLLVVQHHAPHPHPVAAMQWVDGLRTCARLRALLLRRASVQVLHGHLHRVITRVLEIGGILRVFGAPAVVEEPNPRVRFYETSGTGIVPV